MKYDSSQQVKNSMIGKAGVTPAFTKSLALILLSLTTSLAMAAEPLRYVNDYLIINLRSGMGDQYRIIRTLPTGSRLRVLEEQGDYLRVLTDNDIEGWVRGQYLRDTPVARDQLVTVQAKLEKAEAELASVSGELKQLRREHKQLQSEATGLQSQLDKVSKDNAHLKSVAARPLELEQENQQLNEQYAQAEAERVSVQAENDELRSSTAQKWFAAGGGVLVLGIVVGIILPRFRRRRQTGWA